MDKQELIDLAKAKGLDIAEDALQNIGELALEVVGKLVAGSENKYDDMIWAAVEGKAKEELQKIIDKVDGQVG
jgi:hypothetical protein